MKLRMLMIIAFLLTLSSWSLASIVGGESFQALSDVKSEQIHDRIVPWIQQFEADLSSLVLNQGGELRVVLDLDSQRVNSEARRNGREFLVIIYSGLISQTTLSKPLLALILCHEIGHHLGGPPRASRTGWASSEGQADYYSTLECAKEIRDIKYEDMKFELEKLAQFYASIDRSPITPSLGQRDMSTVDRTFFGYPSPQCRLDTMLAGWENKPRPACWYK